jgi:hypothetical protein
MIKSRTKRWVGLVAGMREKSNAYIILVGNPERKKPVGRPRRRWVDNIKMDLRDIGWDDADWIDMAQDRDQCCEHGNEPSGSIKCCEVFE